MNLVNRLKMMQELKSIKEETETCNCGCENCQCNPGEEKTEENETILSDEEIEKIIKTEYGDKTRSELRYIRKFLKLFGNKYTYHKLDFSSDTNTEDLRFKKIIVTCRKHGDFNITVYILLKIGGCPACYIEKDENFDNLFKLFKYKHLPFTRNYLKDKIISGNIVEINMSILSIIAKEDLISIAEETRNDLELFDLSSIKDVIFGINDKFVIKYKSIKDRGIIKDWITDFHHFIERKQIPTELSHFKNWEIRYSKNNYAEITKAKLENKYPNMDFSNFEYIAMKKPITVTCKIHGTEVYYHTIDALLRDGSDNICPECAKENRARLSEAGVFAHKTTEDFIKQCKNIYGDGGRYDYSKTIYIKCNTPVTIYDNLFNEYFEVLPSTFLRGCGNPRNHMSLGETLVYNALIKIKNNYLPELSMKYNVAILNEVEGRKTNKVVIDFICSVNSKSIWIEYNGEQHYDPTFFKHMREEDMYEEEYKNQIRRDKNVVDYCLENNILLIVIPYTYKNPNTIYDILRNILVEGKDQNELIVPVEVKEI